MDATGGDRPTSGPGLAGRGGHRAAFPAALSDTSRNAGVSYLTGHGIAAEVIDGAVV